MNPILKKFEFMYNSYVLTILTVGYILGELGHYLIGVTSKQTAIELDYGDHACQQNDTSFERHHLPTQCSVVFNETACVALNINGTPYCEWNYNGLGLDYQLLAGPSFILIFTIMGVVLGVAADRFNRVRMLTVCTLVFAVAIILQGSVKNYWQLIVLRMIMAAGESGCNPLATGIMSDIFPEKKRALVMAIFNWGIYGGYGIAFPVGRYITKLNIWDLVSHDEMQFFVESILIESSYVGMENLLLRRWYIGCDCWYSYWISIRTGTSSDRRTKSK